jgi:heme-degrading monooxygenase HmoA
MVGVIVTFQYETGFDRTKIEGIANNARATFSGMPGLRSKLFTLDADRARATNVYLWDSKEAASAFFTDQLTERVTGLYGVRPTIEFVEIAAVVDNAAGST